MLPNLIRFQESITEELDVVKNRVRYLIGSKHWGEEGKFKEAILKNVISKHLPKNLTAASGFIMSSTGGNIVSRQIDIIIYDNTYPILFSEGDFIITTEINVKGIIEVKTKLSPPTLIEAIKKLDEDLNNLYFIPEYSPMDEDVDYKAKYFYGIFAFELEGDINSDSLKRTLQQTKKVNHFALGNKYFIKKWRRYDGTKMNPKVISDFDFYNIYMIENLSFSYFISNLLETATGGLEDRYWFNYPIKDTKEVNRIKTINILK